MGHTIARNTIVANLVKNRKFIVDPKEDIKKGDEYIGRLRIKANDARVQVVNLSGGNQQKVVLAKWFNTEGDIFIFDEPTRGIDVGAKQEIYRIMTDLARNNKAILMVSSDMPEVVSMSDRIIVMKDGTVAGEIQREYLSEENILQYSIGGSSI
jgi:ribose transport system ATP-binding protein